MRTVAGIADTSYAANSVSYEPWGRQRFNNVERIDWVAEFRLRLVGLMITRNTSRELTEFSVRPYGYVGHSEADL